MENAHGLLLHSLWQGTVPELCERAVGGKHFLSPAVGDDEVGAREAGGVPANLVEVVDAVCGRGEGVREEDDFGVPWVEDGGRVGPATSVAVGDAEVLHAGLRFEVELRDGHPVKVDGVGERTTGDVCTYDPVVAAAGMGVFGEVFNDHLFRPYQGEGVGPYTAVIVHDGRVVVCGRDAGDAWRGTAGQCRPVVAVGRCSTGGGQ